MEIMIECKHVSKKYRWKKQYFYALCDVSMRIEKGQAVGVMGINGSGKSTLSFLLSEILKPDEGEVQVNGVSSLMTIKTGLQKQLTGYENIRLKAAFLGVPRERVDEKMEEMIAFAELGEYLHMPVKRYSAGMVSRLGFAINLCMDADIFIIDEALSVGDKAFAKKCMEKMKALKMHGKTIVFVSHVLSQIREFCDWGIWMDAGRIREKGEIRTVLSRYEAYADAYNRMSQKEKAERVEEVFTSRLSKRTKGRWLIQGGIAGLAFLYRFCKCLPVRHQILFLSRQSDQPSLDFLLLEQEIHKQDDSIETKILCKTLTKQNVFSYCGHMLSQMLELSRSKVVILDSYCILASVLEHRKDLQIIQLWHSMGSMKKFGYAILDHEGGCSRDLAHLMKMHQNYDYVVASSTLYQEDLEKGFRCDGNRIRVFPLPRVDVLRSKTREAEIRGEFSRRYPELAEKRIVLYCPTFRKKEETLWEQVKKLDALLPKETHQLIVKLHPLSQAEEGNQYFTAEAFDTLSCLFVADYLISDYSCVVYEAAVRQIPTYYFAYDFEDYQKSRGFFIDYEKELSGVVSRDAGEIVDFILHDNYDRDKLKDFSEKNIWNVENATCNLARFVCEVLKGERENMGIDHRV